jgi:hypothetical protein
MLNVQSVLHFSIQLLLRTVFASMNSFTLNASSARVVSRNGCRSSCKIFATIVKFQQKFEREEMFLKMCPISNFVQIFSTVIEMLHSDRWTHRQKTVRITVIADRTSDFTMMKEVPTAHWKSSMEWKNPRKTRLRRGLRFSDSIKQGAHYLMLLLLFNAKHSQPCQ